jgi:hypothetical protein
MKSKTYPNLQRKKVTFKLDKDDLFTILFMYNLC